MTMSVCWVSMTADQLEWNVEILQGHFAAKRKDAIFQTALEYALQALN